VRHNVNSLSISVHQFFSHSDHVIEDLPTVCMDNSVGSFFSNMPATRRHVWVFSILLKFLAISIANHRVLADEVSRATAPGVRPKRRSRALSCCRLTVEARRIAGQRRPFFRCNLPLLLGIHRPRYPHKQARLAVVEIAKNLDNSTKNHTRHRLAGQCTRSVHRVVHACC